MMWLKSCPRCKLGDVTLDEDGDRLCLQCGHIQRSVSEPALAPETAKPLRNYRSKTERTAIHEVQRRVPVAV